MVRVTTWSKREIIKDLVYNKTLTIREISCENDGLVDFYFQIYDDSSEPVDGSTHMKFSPILVPAGQRFSIIFDNKNYPNGFVMSNGMYICSSSIKYSKVPTGGPPLMCCDITYEENTR